MDINTVGESAGRLWAALGAQKRLALGELSKALGGDAVLAGMAAGWLAREGKIEMETQGRRVFLRLTAAEAEEYRKSTGA